VCDNNDDTCVPNCMRCILTGSTREVVALLFITLNVLTGGNEERNTEAINDAGANVHVATLMLAVYLEQLGYSFVRNTNKMGIQTAHQQTELAIYGFIDVGGYIGRMAVVKEAKYNLLSTRILQERGMGSDFLPGESEMVMYTVLGEYMRISQCLLTGLYFVRVISLLPDDRHDGLALAIELNGVVEVNTPVNVAMVSATVVENGPSSSRKKKPTHDQVFRVFRLHRRLYHLHFTVMAEMVMADLLKGADTESWEIVLVQDHYDCFACAVCKWNKLYRQHLPKRMWFPGVPRKVASRKMGSVWSMDYEGPFAQKAVGGYNGCYNFVELETGYVLCFLVKYKTEGFECVRQVAVFCLKYGHIMEQLRTDAGTVEAGALFLEQCALVNGAGRSGVDVRPAPPEEQRLNPWERHHQSVKGAVCANFLEQEYLPNWFFGICKIATCRVRNFCTNELVPGSTPAFLLTGKKIDLDKMMQHSFDNHSYLPRWGNV